jgi:ABC-type sugar transport system ATPase subunit
VAAVTYEKTTKRFGEVVALSSFDLEIAQGELMVLLGPSGSGKTTALRIAAGFEGLSEGVIRIGERDVSRVPPAQRDVAMVFQDYALYPQMTVEQNMGFGLRMRKVKRDEIKTRVARAAETLGLAELLGRRPAQLSGGQRQRVALGRALVRDPEVFLMDEPLSNLDAALRLRMRSEIKSLQQTTGTTTLFVTHDQTEAMTLGTRIAVLSSGVLEQVGSPQEIYQRPVNIFVAGFVGTPPMSFITCTWVERDGGQALVHPSFALKPVAPAGSGSVVVGLRSENVRGWHEQSSLAGPFEGVVQGIEELGRETFAMVGLEDGAEITVQLEGLARVRLGERLRFGIEEREAYVFDATTGATLSWPASSSAVSG